VPTPTQTRLAPTLEAFVMTEVSELQSRAYAEGLPGLHGYPVGAPGGTPQPLSTRAYLETRALATAYAYVTAHAQGTRFYPDPARRSMDLTITAEAASYATAAAQATLWQDFLNKFSPGTGTPAPQGRVPTASPSLLQVSPSLHRFPTSTLPAPSPGASASLQSAWLQAIPGVASAYDGAGEALTTWELVPGSGDFPLFRVTRAPFGISQMSWAPDGRSLWLGLETFRYNQYGLQGTAVVINFDRQVAWLAACSFSSLGRRAFSWSSDGRWLAYLDSGLLWLSAAGGEQRRVLEFPNGLRGDSDVEFSPDGSLVSVLARRQGGSETRYDRLVFDIATRKPIQALLNVGNGPAAWSPDGTHLAQLGTPQGASSGGDWLAVWIWNADTGEMEVTGLPSLDRDAPVGALDEIQWVLDGASLLVDNLVMRGIWLLDLQGRVEKIDDPARAESTLLDSVSVAGGARLSAARQTRPAGGPRCSSASLSPDRRYLVYSRDWDQLHILDLLTRQRFFYRPDDLGVDSLCFSPASIRWSPPGAFSSPRFVFWNNEYSREQIPLTRLIDAASGEIEVLPVAGVYPSWSPDGSMLAFSKWETAGYSLEVLDLASRRQQQLAGPPPDIGHLYYRAHYWPSWSPGGDWIALSGGSGPLPQAYLLHTSSLTLTQPAP
jgi:hypothetical protein